LFSWLTTNLTEIPVHRPINIFDFTPILYRWEGFNINDAFMQILAVL